MTYEYHCGFCGHEFEAEQSIKAEPLVKCPNCHADKLHRVINSAAPFILKGDGWAADNYSKKNQFRATSRGCLVQLYCGTRQKNVDACSKDCY